MPTKDAHDRFLIADTYRPLMARVAHRHAACPADAEDAVTEAMLRFVVAHLDDDSPRARRAWLLSAVVNVCRELHRDRTIATRHLIRLHNARVAPPTPEEQVCDRAEAEHAARQAERLPKPHRIVADVWMGGGTLSEAASRLGRSYKATEHVAAATKRQLRRLIGPPAVVGAFLRGIRQRSPQAVSLAVVAALVVTGLVAVRPGTLGGSRRTAADSRPRNPAEVRETDHRAPQRGASHGRTSRHTSAMEHDGGHKERAGDHGNAVLGTGLVVEDPIPPNGKNPGGPSREGDPSYEPVEPSRTPVEQVVYCVQHIKVTPQRVGCRP